MSASRKESGDGHKQPTDQTKKQKSASGCSFHSKNVFHVTFIHALDGGSEGIVKRTLIASATAGSGGGPVS